MEKIAEKLVEKLIIPPLEFIDRSGEKIKDWIKIDKIKKKIEKDGKFRKLTLSYDEYIFLMEKGKLKLENKKVALFWDSSSEIEIRLFECVIENYDSYRKFSLKGSKNFIKQSSINVRENGTITLEFTGNLNKMKLLNVYYTGRNNMKIKIKCKNDIPQYQDCDEFILTKKRGNITSNELIEMFNEDFINDFSFDKNSEIEIYMNPFEYCDDFRWWAYEEIDKYIVRKWSQGYEATTDFYLKKNDAFNPEDYNSFKTKEYPILTIGSFIGNRYSASETWIKDGKIPEFSNWVSGLCDDDTDYKKYGFDKLLGMEQNEIFKEGQIPKIFSFAKVTMKESTLKIPENSEEYLNKRGINLYPTKIEYLDENFDVISKIEFNKFGVAKFEGFENYREG